MLRGLPNSDASLVGRFRLLDSRVAGHEAQDRTACERAPAGATPARSGAETVGAARGRSVLGGTDTETTAVRDNASRFGLFGARDFAPGWGFYARSELGVDVVDAFDRALNPKANAPEGSGNLFLRVGYLGIDGPLGRASLGKQWSAHYSVAVLTDRFPYSGGLSTAAFNAGTDGDATGTGRAGSSLIYTLEKGGLGLRLQSQYRLRGTLEYPPKSAVPGRATRGED